MLRKHLARFLLGALCVFLILGHAGHIWRIPFVTVLDAYLYGARVRITMPDTVDQRVVIIDIDEKSLGEIGRWPWGRNVVAELVRRLTDQYQVSVVGFDVVFAEPDVSSGLLVLEAIGREQLKGNTDYQRVLSELRPRLSFDHLFAETLRGRPVVLGFYFSSINNAQQGGALTPAAFPPGSFAGWDAAFVSWDGFGANLPLLQAAAARSAHLNPLVDYDGITRRVPMLVEFQGVYYEALSLAVLRTLLGPGELRPRLALLRFRKAWGRLS